LDFYDGSLAAATTDDALVVRFEKCLFYKNRFSAKYGAQTSLVTVNSDQNTIYVLDTIFEQNDMKWNLTSSSGLDDQESHLIESLGPVFMDNTCFIDNRVSASDLAMYGSPLIAQNIFTLGSEGLLCSFASLYETVQQYETRQPNCVGATKSQCELDTPVSSHHQSVIAVDNTGINNDNASAPFQIPRYVPFKVNALEYDNSFELGTDIPEGNCNIERPPIDGPDASLIGDDDAACSTTGPCEISSTETGEYLDYQFGHFRNMEQGNTGLIAVDITVRVSSNESPKKFNLEILTQAGNVQYSQQFESAGLGWDVFTDVTWTNVELLATNRVHTLRFLVVNGGVNICSVAVSYNGSPVLGLDDNSPQLGPDPGWPPTNAPIFNPTSPPSMVDDAAAQDTSTITIAPPPTDNNLPCADTSDLVCVVKENIPEDKINAAIAWACDMDSNPWISLDCDRLYTDTGLHDSNTNAKANAVFDAYWNGVQRADGACCFDEEHDGVDGCIVEIRCKLDLIAPVDNDQEEGSEDFTLIIPGIFSAMSYSESGGSSSSSSSSSTIPSDVLISRGNEDDEEEEGSAMTDPECIGQQQRPGIDHSFVGSQLVDDAICQSAIRPFDDDESYCAIADTQPNDYVVYDFLKDPTKATILVTMRLTSFYESAARIEMLRSNDGVETLIDSINATFKGSNDWTAYTSYILWDSLDIGNDAKYRLKFTFVTGGVQLCSVGIQYALGVS
jgi:X8 domain